MGLTAVAVALQCYLTDRALGTVSAAYNAPPGTSFLPRARTFFAGALIKTAGLFLAILAIGAAVETAYDAEDEDAEGKRRRPGGFGAGRGAAGATGRILGAAGGQTPMSTATVPAATRAHPQPTGPVAVV